MTHLNLAEHTYLVENCSCTLIRYLVYQPGFSFSFLRWMSDERRDGSGSALAFEPSRKTSGEAAAHWRL